MISTEEEEEKNEQDQEEALEVQKSEYPYLTRLTAPAVISTPSCLYP
jgi:hypothetical protein